MVYPAQINTILKTAFNMVKMPAYTPHSLRKTPEQMKAWSMNMVHEHLATTINAYLPVSHERQGALMKAMRDQPHNISKT